MYDKAFPYNTYTKFKTLRKSGSDAEFNLSNIMSLKHDSFRIIKRTNHSISYERKLSLLKGAHATIFAPIN